jgi:hypothetical protein
MRNCYASAAVVFMGSQEIPLSAEEYRRRYVPQHVPHISVSNPGLETVRADVASASGGLLLSVLLLPQELVQLPTLEGYKFQFVPSAYVHANRSV